MTADGFIIPALPDMFSLYGIRNIGKSLVSWKKELDTIFALISEEKRKLFPAHPVQFLGYTIYNAKKATSKNVGNLGLAQAHYNYYKQIPNAIRENIPDTLRSTLSVVSQILMSTKQKCPEISLFHNVYKETLLIFRSKTEYR